MQGILVAHQHVMQLRNSKLYLDNDEKDNDELHTLMYPTAADLSYLHTVAFQQRVQNLYSASTHGS